MQATFVFDQARIAIVGLGYVGLRLAVEFGKHFDIIGFDIDAGRVEELRTGHDRTGETPSKPGLVGGHCIGVDPYRLTHKATVLGYHPELVLAARRINSRLGCMCRIR